MKLNDNIIHQYIKGELEGEALAKFDDKFGRYEFKKRFLAKGLTEAEFNAVFFDAVKSSTLGVSTRTLLSNALRTPLSRLRKRHSSNKNQLTSKTTTPFKEALKKIKDIEITDAHINQYINEELNGETLTAFETQLKTDKDFRKEVEMHQDIDTVLMQNYLDLDDEMCAKEKEKLQPIFDEVNEKYFKVQKEKERRSRNLGFANFNVLPILDFEDGILAIIQRLIPFAMAAALLMLFILNSFVDKHANFELTSNYFESYGNSFLNNLDKLDSASKYILDLGLNISDSNTNTWSGYKFLNIDSSLNIVHQDAQGNGLIIQSNNDAFERNNQIKRGIKTSPQNTDNAEVDLTNQFIHDCCSENMKLQKEHKVDEIFQVSNTITSNADIFANVEYNAGESVTLQPGFSTKNQSNFSINIKRCN